MASQQEVMKLVADDLPDKEIADKLGISVKTVADHKANIRRKYHVRGSAGITKQAILLGLASLSLAFIPNTPTQVTFAWNPQSGVDSFYVYTSPNVTNAMPWTPLTNAAGNASSLSIQVLPGAAFYYLTASNFWGESGPSNIVGTPTVPTNSVLTIRKGP